MQSLTIVEFQKLYSCLITIKTIALHVFHMEINENELK